MWLNVIRKKGGESLCTVTNFEIKFALTLITRERLIIRISESRLVILKRGYHSKLESSN